MRGVAGGFISSTNVSATLSIIVARIFYAVNWFNVAAVFPLIALDFEQDIALLGSISAAFFIGVGVFQVPAGIFAAKYSPRTSAILGIALSSLAALLYGFASEASQLVWLRFIVGAGMAFFFSSGVVLIARYAGARSSGFSIGLMNSAHSIGGIIGIFAWIVIAQVFGWRPSLILGGAIGIATAVMMVVAIPRRPEPPAASSGGEGRDSLHEEEEEEEEPRGGGGSSNSGRRRKRRWLNISEIWRILSNPPLVALGLVLTGVQAAWALNVTFIVVYLQSLGIPLESTGVIASLSLITAIVSAPLIGRFYDRTVRDARMILLICGVGICAAIAAMSVPVLPVIIAATVALGFFAGGAFTVAYAKARTMRTIDDQGLSQPEEEGNNNRISRDSALNVAWINGLSLLGVVWMPLVFSLAVKSWGGGGYQSAWILSGVLTALFIFIPLYKVTTTTTTHQA